MNPYRYLLPLLPIVCLVAHAQENPPAEALKYHEALLKHPHNTTVFSRFYETWLDTQSIESLEAFLKKRAETHGANDHIILARYQLQRGQDSNALSSFNKAVESLPEDPALLLERANLLLRSLNFQAARRDLEAVTKLGNETLSIEASKLIGKSHFREGNPAEAIKAWDGILTTHPKNEDLLEDLVEIASAADQPEQALNYSEKLIAISADPYKKALRLIRRGELLAKSNESDKAITLWSETLAQTGEGSWLEREILAFIEQSYRRLDRIDLLKTKLEELATAHPRRLVIHRELAKLEAASGNIDSAIGRFREVLRRSPGEPELREEFIRLLISSERFDDASAEIGKMLATTPNNPELHLRLADLAFQKSQSDPAFDKTTASAEILKSLTKAREFMDPGEASGLRISSLMIRYGLAEHGENLLKELSSAPNATSAPAEALAAEYIRTKRTPKALEILNELAKSKDIETVLRTANSMAPLTKAEIPFDLLLSRLPDFPNNNPSIAALAQASLAAKQPAKAIPSVLKLVRSSKLASEIQDSTKLATTVIVAAGKPEEIITELSNIETPSLPETCLLASLFEIQKSHSKTDALFANSNDPILLRFHASLLSVRGDFPAAIATLHRLTESASDSSASYFKELSDLQLRAGDTQAALKTIEKWKVAAPTDKSPWTIATRLLRESGSHSEAMENTRRALSRFNNDEDLTAILGDLYQESGNHKEAERIFWKLYDQAPDSAAQSRWAARLANLAHRYGKTEELKEKFIQRSRSNHQSIGPILALIEIARASQDQTALLEHLYHALRIKPKDVDIRMQLASAEKQAGNIDKQMQLLNDGADQDTTGRIRTSLAQALIDQGQIIKGMHMLRALSGQGGTDQRFIESSANSIASSGLLAEAIQYLEESLPPNPDWRSRFLMAQLLQKDGREAEATTILLSLMEAKDEIPGLIPNLNFSNLQQQMKNKDYYFQSLLNFLSQELYALRNSRHSFTSGRQSILPSSVEELRFRSKILLGLISNTGNPALTDQIKAAKIDGLDLITDMIACHSENGVDYLALLEKHPTNTQLIQLVAQQGRLRNPDTGENYSIQKTLAIYNKLLELPDLDHKLRNQLILVRLQTDTKNLQSWDSFLNLLESETKLNNSNSLRQLTYQLKYIVMQDRTAIPAPYQQKVREILLKNAESNNVSEQLFIHALFREIDPWIETFNKQIADYQKQFSARTQPQQKNTSTPQEILSRYGFYVQPPQISNLPITSLNTSHLRSISSTKYENSSSHSEVSLSAKDLVKHLERFESPALRAWIAILADDEKAIKKTLSAKPSAIEAGDFVILRAYADYESKRYPESCRSLIQLADNPNTNPNIAHWATTTFLAVLSETPANKRSEFLPKAREIIGFFSQKSPEKSPARSSDHNLALLSVSQQLGFEDLVAQLTPPVAPQKNRQPRRSFVPPTNTGKSATITPQTKNPNQQKQRAQTPIERFQQYSNEGKHDAAAHEFLSYVDAQKKQGYEISYILSNLKLTDDVRNRILAISDPGNNPSLTKRMSYIEICLAFQETDTALTLLRALAVQRPFDPNINLQLAFALPEQDSDTAVKLLQQFSESPEFYQIFNNYCQRIYQGRNGNDNQFKHFNLLAKFIEITDPEKIDPRTTSDINRQIYYFFSGNNLSGISSLIKSESSKSKETPDSIKHLEICRRLVNAMKRHPLLSEFAFRLSRAAEWIQQPADIDELARYTMLIEAQITSQRYNDSGGYLPEFSSANWICDRIKQAKSPGDILPPDFLTSIEKHDPTRSSLLKAFSTLKTSKDLTEFWDTGVMLEGDAQTSDILIRNALLEKISSIPGSSEFFISRIKNLSQHELINARSQRSGEYKHLALIHAALSSSKNQSEANVRKLCKTIVDSVYGEDFDFDLTGKDSNSRDYQIISNASSLMDSIFNRQILDPVTSIRIFRSMDSLRVPMQNNYWIQNITRSQGGNVPPDEALKFLDSMGFLKDTNDWKPLAYSELNNHYDPITRKSSLFITRNMIDERILSDYSYRLNRTEFVSLLENRKPQTFGNLITAAYFANNQQQREQLFLKAFKHAAPQLAKASPQQIEDFNLLTAYLPSESIDFLPAKLRQKIKERDAEKIVTLMKAIDLQKKQIEAYPSQDPFSTLDNSIVELAQYDAEKATELFMWAYSTYKTNLSLYSVNSINAHQNYFDSVVGSMITNTKTPPANGLKFYHAIMNSPQAKDFGYASQEDSTPYLYTVGSHLMSRYGSGIDPKTPQSLRPWLIASRMPEELQNDALAAMTCYLFCTRNSTPSSSEIKPVLEKTDGLSAKSKELIISCFHLNNSGSISPEHYPAIIEHVKNILDDPIFSPNSRRQIALSMLQTTEFLMIPEVAKIFSEVISDLSKEDRSMVNPMIINTLTNFYISNSSFPAESLPHYKSISESFWDNANSPKSGGHPPISEDQAIGLFLFSMKSGDEKNIQLLIPKIRGIATGNITFITQIISSECFSLADEFLPGDAEFFFNTEGFYHSPELMDKLLAYANQSKKSAQIARLESHLIRIVDSPSQHGEDFMKKLQEHRKRLFEFYQANPPESAQVSSEILSAIHNSITPAEPAIQEEISKIAAKLDPDLAVSAWFQNYREARRTGLPEEAPVTIIYSAAMANLIDGKPELFISTCEALTKLLQKTNEDDDYHLQPFTESFINPSLITTTRAVTENKTSALPKILPALEKLIVQLSKHKQLSNNELSSSLIIYDFISHWENQPDNVAQLLKKLNTEESRNLEKLFASPRMNFLFIERYSFINDAHELAHYGDRPIQLATSILSRESLSPIYVTSFSWLDTMQNQNLQKEIKELTLNPPDSLSPSGKAFLKYHAATDHIPSNPEKITAYQALIKEIPAQDHWHQLTVNSKLHLVTAMLGNQESKIEEVRAVFDSIDPKNIPESNKDFYERALKELRNAESKTE